MILLNIVRIYFLQFRSVFTEFMLRPRFSTLPEGLANINEWKTMFDPSSVPIFS